MDRVEKRPSRWMAGYLEPRKPSPLSVAALKTVKPITQGMADRIGRGQQTPSDVSRVEEVKLAVRAVKDVATGYADYRGD